MRNGWQFLGRTLDIGNILSPIELFPMNTQSPPNNFPIFGKTLKVTLHQQNLSRNTCGGTSAARVTDGMGGRAEGRDGLSIHRVVVRPSMGRNTTITTITSSDLARPHPPRYFMRKPLEENLLKAYFRQRVTDFENSFLRRRRRRYVLS